VKSNFSNFDPKLSNTEAESWDITKINDS